jgi:cytochrome c biogenesis protein CcmG, thiol:disulfide interchange protein DsbE
LSSEQKRRIPAILASLAILAAGCGSDEPPPPAGVQDSPAALARQASEIVGGGESSFHAQLEALRGHPIVVNKWASWCGPCRFEFPFFRRLATKQGKTIAFIGVDSRDSREGAQKFLEKFPVPYPSFYDRKGEIARVFRGDRAFPTTAFYSAGGELVFTKQGGYASEAAIAKDIEQYLR